MRGEVVTQVNYPESTFITIKPKKYEYNFANGEDEQGKVKWVSRPLAGLRFVFLDNYQRIFGEHKGREVEVKSTIVREKNQPFIVKTKKGGQLLMQGTWDQIRDDALENRLCKGFDVLALSEKGKLITLRMNSWASAIAWSEFYWDNVNEIQGDFMVEFVEGEQIEGKKGSWFKPQFKLVPLSKELSDLANKVVEEQVKPFVEDYFSGLELKEEGLSEQEQDLGQGVNNSPVPEERLVDLDHEDDLPF